MRLHRFYVEQSIGGSSFDITDKDLVHQWKSVFRYNVGSQVILFDGSGSDYLCIISSLRQLGASVGVIQKTNLMNKSKINIFLCLGLIKKDNFEFAVQKATEIGINHFVPVLCERSEKKRIDIGRLRKISVEASEQSGRGDVPTVYETMTLEKLLDENLLPDRAVYLNSVATEKSLNKDEIKDIAIFIGPEGGWTESEIELFNKRNIKAISLGDKTLRSETAAIAISSLLLL